MAVVMFFLPVRLAIVPLVCIAPVGCRGAVRRVQRRSLGAQDRRRTGGKGSDEGSMEAGAEVR